MKFIGINRFILNPRGGWKDGHNTDLSHHMNRTDRLLGIILQLQNKKIQRAEDLAATFETSVRTIYRDMQALSEAGVPIVGATGQGYSLVEGYFLPPVMFTVEEAVTLLLGLEFVHQQFDESYRSKAISAQNKIETVLSNNVLKKVKQVSAGMKLVTSPDGSEQHMNTMVLLRLAIGEHQQIRFRYTKNQLESVDNENIRQTDPYGLIFTNGAWTLIAFCHLRQEMRHFLLGRMSDVHVMGETFSLPPQFDLNTYKPPDNRHLLVRIVIRPHLANKVKEYQYYYIDTMEDRVDGLYITLRVRHLDEVLQWILSWGEGVVVLEPEMLRKRIQEEAKKMLKRY